MPRFNRDKYITEGSYPSDLNDPVVMNKDKKSLIVISNFLGIDWDDEITVMPEPKTHTFIPKHYVETDKESNRGIGRWGFEYAPTGEPPMTIKYDDNVFSYLVEGTDPDGQEVLFLRRTTRYSSSPILFIGGVQVNANKIVQAAKTEDPTFKEVRQPRRAGRHRIYSVKEDLDWS